MANTIKPYGCHNRQLKNSYQTLVRDIDSAGNLIGLKMVTIRNTMSQDCHYDLKEVDVRCSNCEWVDYIPIPF